MKIKKFTALLLALLLAVSLCCVGSAEEGYAANPNLDANAELTLTLYGPGLFATVGETGSINLTSGITTPGYQDVMARWNSFYPNVKLDIQPIPWSDWQANVTTAVMGGDVDVILHGATLAALCEDLQTYIDATDNYMENIYLVASRYTADNPSVAKVSGVSYTVTPMLVYLDTEIFKNYGVELPGADWTWEELLAIAEKLTGTDPVTGEQTYGFKFPSRVASNNFYFNHMMLSQAYGGNIIQYGATLAETTANYKNEASLKAFEIIGKLAAFVSPDNREGIVDDTVLTAENNVAIRIEQDPFNHYAEAEAAGDVNRWMWHTLPCAVEGEGVGKPSYMLGENNMSIAYNSDAKDWAWEFIRFMTTDTVVQDWIVSTRNLPNNIAGQTLLAPSVGEEKATTMYAALESLPYGWNNATNDCVNTAFMGTLASDIYVAQDSVIKGEFTPEQAADYVQKNLDTFMSTTK